MEYKQVQYGQSIGISSTSALAPQLSAPVLLVELFHDHYGTASVYRQHPGVDAALPIWPVLGRSHMVLTRRSAWHHDLELTIALHS